MPDIRKFRESERSGHHRASDLAVIVGFLDDDLAAATNALTGATSAQISVVEWKSDTPAEGGTGAEWYETQQKATVVNRTSSRESFTDHLVVAVWVGEWLVIDASCAPER